MTTELKYDPEMPFVTVSDLTGYVSGRFPTEQAALKWADKDDFVKVVDTTPTPKIPEDAEFIYYYKAGYDFYVRQLENGDWKTDGGVLYSYSEVLEVVENAEVTVLVRKEET